MANRDYERGGRVWAPGPAYEVLCRVRGLGYAETHLAAIPVRSVVPLLDSRFDGRAYHFGAASPVAAICGSRVRSSHPFVVIMEIMDSPVRVSGADAFISCRPCLRGAGRWQASRERRLAEELFGPGWTVSSDRP